MRNTPTLKGAYCHIRKGVGGIHDRNREELSEMLWLLYFNEALYQKGAITEAERNRMKGKIRARMPADGRGEAY